MTPVDDITDCPSCNKPVPPDAEWCHWCGARVRDLSSLTPREMVIEVVRWTLLVGLPPAAAALAGVVLMRAGEPLVPAVVSILIGCVVGWGGTIAAMWWTAETMDRQLFDNGVAYVGPAIMAAALTLGVGAVIG